MTATCVLSHQSILVESKPMSVVSSRKPYRVGRSRTGLGLFATKPIAKGDEIIRYLGRMLDSRNKDDDAVENKYLFQINGRWTIDGSRRSNIARYINHACRPNAESEVNQRQRTVIIRAIKNIAPGEEINYDYGTEYFKMYLKPIGCKCGSCERRRARQAAEPGAAKKAANGGMPARAVKAKAAKAKVAKGKTATANGNTAKGRTTKGKTAKGKTAKAKAGVPVKTSAAAVGKSAAATANSKAGSANMAKIPGNAKSSAKSSAKTSAKGSAKGSAKSPARSPAKEKVPAKTRTSSRLSTRPPAQGGEPAILREA